MIEEKEHMNRGRIIGGATLIVLGAMLFLERYGVVEIGRYWRYWPLSLVFFGLFQLIAPRCPADRGSGVWLLLAGVWLQVNLLGLFGLHWRNSWPLLLIFIGVGVLLGGLFPQLDSEDSATDS
jgi:drug/metabolite transporter (DMT)-like permease